MWTLGASPSESPILNVCNGGPRKLHLKQVPHMILMSMIPRAQKHDSPKGLYLHQKEAAKA